MNSVVRNKNAFEIAMGWRDDDLEKKNKEILQRLEDEMFNELRRENNLMINTAYRLSRPYIHEAEVISAIDLIENFVFKANIAQEFNNRVNESNLRNIINEKCAEIIKYINSTY